MKPSPQNPSNTAFLGVSSEEAQQPSRPSTGFRRLSYQAQRDIQYFVRGLDESFQKPVLICAGLQIDADLEQIASKESIMVDALEVARGEIKKLIEQTGSADDLVKREIERLLSSGPAPVSSPAQQEVASVAEKPMSPNDHVRVLIAKFSGDEEVLLRDYLEIDRNDQKKVIKMTQKHGVRFLAVENEFSETAEQLGCTVEAMRNAVGIVRGGGTVAAEHLTSKKDEVVIPSGRRGPFSERIGPGIRQFPRK